MKNKKALIIGSGPTGIGAALGLDNDCTVLEATNNVGGFSTSINIRGAVFDYGGHSFHTPHPEVRNLVFNALDMYVQKREAKCLVQNQLISYPFQKNYNQLSDKKIVQDCTAGLSGLQNGEPASNFEEFIYHRFGQGIAEHFMLPYNRKLWGRDLTRLASDWTSQRVAAPKGTEEQFDTKGGNRKPLQANTEVAYPAKGGFGEIWNALGKRIKHIELNTKVARIDPRSKRVFTTDNKSHDYNSLISSIPITKLLEIIEGTPLRLLERASLLDNLSLQLGLVVINHPVDTDIQRIYSAEPHIPSHKTAINHNSSDYLRGLPKHGVMMEISEGPEKTMLRNDLERWILDSLLEMGLIKSANEVEEIVLKHATYAYPVPTHGRNDIIEDIQEFLSEHDIFTIGRFGQWAYINSDESLYRGLQIGKKISEL